MMRNGRARESAWQRPSRSWRDGVRAVLTAGAFLVSAAEHRLSAELRRSFLAGYIGLWREAHPRVSGCEQDLLMLGYPLRSLAVAPANRRSPSLRRDHFARRSWSPHSRFAAGETSERPRRPLTAARH